jgi:hypothetical protein
MFQMMNEARIGVGVGAAALAYAGYRHAVDYARDRRQGRTPAMPVETDPVPIIQHPDVRRMLLAQKVYAEGALALCLYAARLVDLPDDGEAVTLLGLLTPIAKTWSSEYGLAANALAMQVHGGYGYTRDFPVEQIYRDNRLNPIHEGTTSIQAIDLLRRKVIRSDGAGLTTLFACVHATIAKASSHDQLSLPATSLLATQQKLALTIERLRTVPEDRQIDNATLFLQSMGHFVVAWLWLDQATASLETDNALAEAKLHACRYFFEFELPKADLWMSIVSAASDTAALAPIDIF